MPVNFNQEHKMMLQHAKIIFEREKIAINPKLDKLDKPGNSGSPRQHD